MHGMVGGEAREIRLRGVCVVCTRETQGRETERQSVANDYRIADSHWSYFPMPFSRPGNATRSVVQGPCPRGDRSRKRRPLPTHDTRITNTPDQPNRQAQTDVPRLKVRTSLRPPMNNSCVTERKTHLPCVSFSQKKNHHGERQAPPSLSGDTRSQNLDQV